MLSFDDPRPLLTCALSELRELVSSVEQWTAFEAEQLDVVLRSRTSDLLTGRAPSEDLAALGQLVRTMVPRSRRDELPKGFTQRWLGLADLLDTRRGQLRHLDPERILQKRHVPEILSAVRSDPGLTQSQLADRVGLTAPNLSGVLRVLEDHHLIERDREGRSKRVYLPGRRESVPSMGGHIWAGQPARWAV